MDQIADAVDVSPRTFARYFPTKDSAILSLLDHLTAAVNDELALVDPEVPPFEALLTANIGMLRHAMRGSGPMTLTRITTLLRVVNTSHTLQSLSVALRSQETAVAMAKRLNTTSTTTPCASSVRCGERSSPTRGARWGPTPESSSSTPTTFPNACTACSSTHSLISPRSPAVPDDRLTPAHRRSPVVYILATVSTRQERR